MLVDEVACSCEVRKHGLAAVILYGHVVPSTSKDLPGANSTDSNDALSMQQICIGGCLLIA